jgi:predicted PP-loop superfamily ATPase
MFVNDVKYVGVTFHSRMKCRTHIDFVVTRALRAFLKIYSLLKSEKLSIISKMTLHKALIRSRLTYACPTWESAADKHLLKLRRLQTKYSVQLVAYEAHANPLHAYDAPNSVVYDFITKSCRKQAEVI